MSPHVSKELKIAIFNNDSDDLNSLVKLVKKTSPFAQVHQCDDIASTALDDVDLVILSGGLWYDDPSLFSKKYQSEIDYVQNTTIPVIGICLGFQIISLAYGGEVQKLKKEYHGLSKIHITDEGQKILGWNNNFLHFENHTMGVTNVPHQFIEIAKSAESSEIIMHQSKPIIGVQFHPEKLSKKQHAQQIWHTLVWLVTK